MSTSTNIPSSDGESFTDQEIRLLWKEIARRTWRPGKFYEEFEKANPNFVSKSGSWKDNIRKVISRAGSPIRAQDYHRAAIANAFGWTPEQFAGYLITGKLPSSSTLEAAVVKATPSAKADPGHTESKVKLMGRENSLDEKLLSRGVIRSPELERATFLDDRLVIYDAILDGAIAGFAGVTAEQLTVKLTPERPAFPEYVLKKKQTFPEPHPNRKKVFLARWTPPILDSGSILELTLGHTDFWTTEAARECVARVHKDILQGNLSLFTLPRRMDLVLIVLTADDRIALCKRAGGTVVRYYPLYWEVSVAESMDASEDVDQSGRANPLCTVRRAFKEELGVPDSAADDARLKFVSIGTEWPLLFANLVCIAQLAVPASRLRDWWQGRPDHEHTILDTPNFALDSCLDLVLRGTHESREYPESAAPLYPMARLALFSALCSEFGYTNVIAKI